MEITMTFPISKYHIDLVADNMKYHNDLGVTSFLLLLHDLTYKEKKSVDRLTKLFKCQIIDWENPVFEDAKIRTTLANEAYKRFKSDWIINNDVDEYWVPRKLNLQQILSKYGKYNCLSVKRYNMVAYVDVGNVYINPPRSYRYAIINPIREIKKDNFDAINPLDFTMKAKASKACCRGFGIISVGPGSHFVDIKNKLSTECNDLVIFHYPYTTEEAFIKEIAIKSASMLIGSNDINQNFHIKYLNHYLNNGAINKIIKSIFPNTEIVKKLIASKRIAQTSIVYDYFNTH